MNANAKLNEILKNKTVSNPSWFNKGNLNTVQFKSATKEEPKQKVLTDADLGLTPTKKISKTTENREA